MAETNNSNKRYYKANPVKFKAKTAVNNAVKDGYLDKRPCQICGDPKSHGHHSSYDKSKWLEVIWLCPLHHKKAHRIGEALQLPPPLPLLICVRPVTRRAKLTPKKILSIRYKHGLSQGQFWGRIGVQQSAASRYETGSRPPDRQTELLLTLAYGTGAEAIALYRKLRK